MYIINNKIHKIYINHKTNKQLFLNTGIRYRLMIENINNGPSKCLLKLCTAASIDVLKLCTAASIDVCTYKANFTGVSIHIYLQ